MKAKSIIIAAILTITTSMLFAENDIVSTPVANENASVISAAIAPVTPAEVTFEEVSTEVIDFATLAPSLPLEADFNDDAYAMIDINTLAPSTPRQAAANWLLLS
jgi:hypothetical protein